jgi:hypothetical protein
LTFVWATAILSRLSSSCHNFIEVGKISLKARSNAIEGTKKEKG